MKNTTSQGIFKFGNAAAFASNESAQGSMKTSIKIETIDEIIKETDSKAELSNKKNKPYKRDINLSIIAAVVSNP